MLKLILSGVYIGALLMSPIFNAKIVHFGAWQFLAWTPMVVLTSAIVDVINQNWGKKDAKELVLVALIVRGMFYLVIFPLLFLMSSPEPMFQQAFRNFLVSQGVTFVARYYVQIPMFARMNTWFSLKYNASGFVFSGFKGALQTFLMYVGTPVPIGGLIVTETITKWGFLTLATPLASLINFLVKRTVRPVL